MLEKNKGKHFTQKEVVSNIYYCRKVKEDNGAKSSMGLVIRVSVVKQQEQFCRLAGQGAREERGGKEVKTTEL